MRIAINIDGQFNSMSGIQQYVDSLLNALYDSKTPHDITAFTPGLGSMALLRQQSAHEGWFAWRDNKRARVETAGSAFQLTESPVFRNSALLRYLAERIDWRVIAPAKRRTFARRVQAASRKYDLLHTPSPATLHFEICRARYNVVTIYDLTTRICPWAHSPDNIAIWERLFDYAQKHCARIITISEASKRDIVEHLGIPEDRVDVTYPAAKAATRLVDDEHGRRESLSAVGVADTPFVLYAGTLEPRKNLEVLIRAFSSTINEDRVLPHKLVLAGGSISQYDHKLLRLAQELGIAERVVTTGFVSNHLMNALMSACDAFVYVSQYEGFGLPPLEAMVCGAPVITSDVSSLPEVVGGAGIQVSPTNTEQIAAAIHLLLTNANENARRRKLSVERAEHFTWERTAALTLRSYEAAVS
ncbi:MAG: glycosyltransferase family 4 protein [Pyrinomonadaceae bacterium]